MLLLVRQVLGVDANNLTALVTVVCEHILVTLGAAGDTWQCHKCYLDTVGVVVSEHIPARYSVTMTL